MPTLSLLYIWETCPAQIKFPWKRVKEKHINSIKVEQERFVKSFSEDVEIPVFPLWTDCYFIRNGIINTDSFGTFTEKIYSNGYFNTLELRIEIREDNGITEPKFEGKKGISIAISRKLSLCGNGKDCKVCSVRIVTPIHRITTFRAIESFESKIGKKYVRIGKSTPVLLAIDRMEITFVSSEIQTFKHPLSVTISFLTAYAGLWKYGGKLLKDTLGNFLKFLEVFFGLYYWSNPDVIGSIKHDLRPNFHKMDRVIATSILMSFREFWTIDDEIKFDLLKLKIQDHSKLVNLCAKTPLFPDKFIQSMTFYLNYHELRFSDLFKNLDDDTSATLEEIVKHVKSKIEALNPQEPYDLLNSSFGISLSKLQKMVFGYRSSNLRKKMVDILITLINKRIIIEISTKDLNIKSKASSLYFLNPSIPYIIELLKHSDFSNIHEEN